MSDKFWKPIPNNGFRQEPNKMGYSNSWSPSGQHSPPKYNYNYQYNWNSSPPTSCSKNINCPTGASHWGHPSKWSGQSQGQWGSYEEEKSFNSYSKNCGSRPSSSSPSSSSGWNGHKCVGFEGQMWNCCEKGTGSNWLKSEKEK